MIETVRTISDAETIFEDWLRSNYSLGKMKKMRVFLKPNIGYPKKSPFTTNLDLIYSIVKLLNKFDFAEIIIGEGSTSKNTALENFSIVGLQKKLMEFQITYLDLNQQQAEKIELQNKSVHYLPSILEEIELKISLPVIKFYDDDEGNTFLSNAIKNFFGLPPKKMYKIDQYSNKRDSLHDNLHKSVAEIYTAIEQFAPFNLYICDGLKILNGEAAYGDPMDWDYIIISDDAIKADLQVLEMLEKPKPKYLKTLIENEK